MLAWELYAVQAAGNRRSNGSKQPIHMLWFAIAQHQKLQYDDDAHRCYTLSVLPLALLCLYPTVHEGLQAMTQHA